MAVSEWLDILHSGSGMQRHLLRKRVGESQCENEWEKDNNWSWSSLEGHTGSLQRGEVDSTSQREGCQRIYRHILKPSSFLGRCRKPVISQPSVRWTLMENDRWPRGDPLSYRWAKQTTGHSLVCPKDIGLCLWTKGSGRSSIMNQDSWFKKQEIFSTPCCLPVQGKAPPPPKPFQHRVKARKKLVEI